MLTVYFGNKEDAIFRIANRFNHMFMKEWFDREDVKEMVLEVDRSTVLGNGVIDSPMLGLITPRELSTGVKALILMTCEDNIDNKFFDGDLMGDNCVPWLYRISQTKNINITLTHLMDFSRVENVPGFNILIENDGRIIKDYESFIKANFDFI